VLQAICGEWWYLAAQIEGDNAVGVLLRENDGPIWQHDQPFWTGVVNQQESHGAIGIQSSHGSVNFISEEQAPLLIESQVVGSPFSLDEKAGSVVRQGRPGCTCWSGPGGVGTGVGVGEAAGAVGEETTVLVGQPELREATEASSANNFHKELKYSSPAVSLMQKVIVLHSQKHEDV